MRIAGVVERGCILRRGCIRNARVNSWSSRILLRGCISNSRITGGACRVCECVHSLSRCPGTRDFGRSWRRFARGRDARARRAGRRTRTARPRRNLAPPRECWPRVRVVAGRPARPALLALENRHPCATARWPGRDLRADEVHGRIGDDSFMPHSTDSSCEGDTIEVHVVERRV
jgi:hypothetical protein